jgi:uncharacterized protein (UPF0335 family)
MKATRSSPDQVSAADGVAADELRQFIERLERLEEEKAGILGDIKEVFAEAKGRGFDTKAMRTILRIRKQDHSERQEQEAILELYMQALGMLADTPLGRAAVSRDLGGRSGGERALRAEIGDRLQQAFGSMEGVTVTVGRDAGPILRKAAKSMRAAGAQIDLEDAIEKSR